MRKSVTSDPAVVADVLDRAEVLHLALVDKDGPHCVVVNFVRQDQILYVHTGLRGRKYEALASGAPLAFAAEVDLKITPGEQACKWGYHFKSVQGRGLPRLLESREEKRRALGLIMRKYAGADDFPVDEAVLGKTGVAAIAVETVTARVKG